MTMARLQDRRRSASKGHTAPKPVPGTEWSAKPVWALLGYQSEADYEVLAKAVDCGLCGRPLPAFHRYRVTPPLEAPDGGWTNRWRQQSAEAEHRSGEADLCICGRCKALTDMGQWPIRQHPTELLQGRLFD